MVDLLLAPGAPYYALSVVGVLLAIVGLLKLERARLVMVGVRGLPTRWGMRGRYVLGHAAGIPCAAALLLAAFAGGVEGMARLLILGLALALYLWLAIALPRRPLVQAQRERRRLRALTPGFVNYVRVALAGFDSPAQLLERYVSRTDPRKAPLQRLVAEALDLRQQRRYQPFEALRIVARERQCQELIDVAEALAQSEDQGSNPLTALASQERVLVVILEDEFKQMLSRRQIYLLVLVALSLVVGVLGNLLWIMVAGSGLLF